MNDKGTYDSAAPERGRVVYLDVTGETRSGASDAMLAFDEIEERACTAGPAERRDLIWRTLGLLESLHQLDGIAPSHTAATTYRMLDAA
jgi:hypothetical protein